MLHLLISIYVHLSNLFHLSPPVFFFHSVLLSPLSSLLTSYLTSSPSLLCPLSLFSLTPLLSSHFLSSSYSSFHLFSVHLFTSCCQSSSHLSNPLLHSPPLPLLLLVPHLLSHLLLSFLSSSSPLMLSVLLTSMQLVPPLCFHLPSFFFSSVTFSLLIFSDFAVALDSFTLTSPTFSSSTRFSHFPFSVLFHPSLFPLISSSLPLLFHLVHLLSSPLSYFSALLSSRYLFLTHLHLITSPHSPPFTVSLVNPPLHSSE